MSWRDWVVWCCGGFVLLLAFVGEGLGLWSGTVFISTTALFIALYAKVKP